MAELLIKAVDATHPDGETDRAGCYKRGDVVVVQEDGHQWGMKEGPPRFFVLKIPGVEKSRVERLCEEQDDDDAGRPFVDGEGRRRVFRRRRWRVDIDSLPAPVRNALSGTGVASITRLQILSALVRKRDGGPFTNL